MGPSVKATKRGSLLSKAVAEQMETRWDVEVYSGVLLDKI